MTNRGVLCLNASWEPLRILSLNRAICLVLSGKAEVIEDQEDAYIRSESTSMSQPSVIKLKYFVQIPYKSRVPLNRKTLMARDQGVCQYIVNGHECTRVGNTIDHVKPRAAGGLHEWTNTVACCQKHNTQKRDLLLEKLDGWELRRQPQAPSGAKWLVLGLAAGRNEEVWSPYLDYGLA